MRPCPKGKKLSPKEAKATPGTGVTNGVGRGGHLALNYWFHPPVGAQGAGDHPPTYNFNTPYGSAAQQTKWEADWAMWEELFASS